MDHNILILRVPVVLIDINPHTKFQVATIIGTVVTTSYKNHNLSPTESHIYRLMDVHMYRSTHVQMNEIMYIRMHN